MHRLTFPCSEWSWGVCLECLFRHIQPCMYLCAFEPACASQRKGAAESWKAVHHLKPYIRGGVWAEQCVPSFTEDTVQTFSSLSARIRLLHFVCMHACMCKTATLVDGEWTLSRDLEVVQICECDADI